jgi:hypothetical protein
MSYIGNEPIVSATRTVTEVTATAGQTVFNANGGYTVGYLDVFLNGSKLTTTDFTATNGSSITLTESAQVGDIVRLEAWGTFSTSNLVSPNYTGTLTGGTDVVNIGSGQFYKDASGNVGIGTSSPSQKLHVNGNVQLADTVFGNGSIEVGAQGNGDRASLIDFHSSGAPSTLDLSARINRTGGVNGTWDFSNTGSGNIDFYQGGSLKLSVDGSGATIRSAGISYPTVASTFSSGANRIGFTWRGSDLYGTVDNVVEMVVGSLSDYRLKTNNQPLTEGLKTVLALRPVTYNTISFDGTVDTDKTVVGLIAHEVQAVRPSVVAGEKDAIDNNGNPRYQSVNYAGLVPDLIKAIQEQQAIIQSQADTITAMEVRLTALENK